MRVSYFRFRECRSRIVPIQAVLPDDVYAGPDSVDRSDPDLIEVVIEVMIEVIRTCGSRT